VCGNDVIILSRYALSNNLNCLNRRSINQSIGYLKTVGPIWNAKNHEIRFSTISSFKGLESKVVILCDVDSFTDSRAKMLNYIAISRACSLLYILYDSSQESARQSMLVKGFQINKG
jgi:superfamily I DNA/RNA helicase